MMSTTQSDYKHGGGAIKRGESFINVDILVYRSDALTHTFPLEHHSMANRPPSLRPPIVMYKYAKMFANAFNKTALAYRQPISQCSTTFYILRHLIFPIKPASHPEDATYILLSRGTIGK